MMIIYPQRGLAIYAFRDMDPEFYKDIIDLPCNYKHEVPKEFNLIKI